MQTVRYDQKKNHVQHRYLAVVISENGVEQRLSNPPRPFRALPNGVSREDEEIAEWEEKVRSSRKSNYVDDQIAWVLLQRKEMTFNEAGYVIKTVTEPYAMIVWE